MMHSTRGFTLVEAIIAMVITGIIAAMVAVFLKAPVQGYVDSARRAELTDLADTVLRRMVRDLRLALPNSVRTTTSGGSTYLEFLLTSGGGRYRAKRTGAGTGDPLDFDTSDASFDVIGTAPACAPGQSIVIFNLGPSVTGADAYAGDNRVGCSGVAGSTVTLSSAFRFPFESPGNRFQVIDTPVTYECTPNATTPSSGVIRRYWSYSIAPGQPAPPSGGQNALIANNVAACGFSYSALALAERSGIVALSITVSESSENVSLTHEAHVSNIP